MKILIIVKNFWPELTGIGVCTGDLADWLHTCGHRVSVITTVPHYPAWSVADNEKILLWCKDTRKPYRVMRGATFIPKKPGAMSRVLNALSFAATATPLAMLEALRQKPDIVMAVVPTLMAVPAMHAIGALTGARSWIHVQDLEVDAAIEMKLLTGRVARLASTLERWLLRRAGVLSTISEKMAARLAEKCPGADIKVFPNWIDDVEIRPLAGPSPLRAKLKIAAQQKLVLFTGSLVAKQGLEIIPAAARLLKDRSDIYFLVCGEGPLKETIQQQGAPLGNMGFLPLQPRTEFNALLNAADIHLLPQLPNMSDLVMPSKLGPLLASGRPVVASVDATGTVARMVEGAGIIVPPGDAAALAAAIAALADNPQKRRQLGERARARAVETLGRSRILSQIDRMLSAGLGKP